MNHDDDFDGRVRHVWRSSIDAVPPMLARRLRPSARETSAPARWPLGAALAAAAVLALALGLRSHPVGLPQAGPDTVVAHSGSGADDAAAPLDRNPDFYAWLASPDAEQLAME